MLEAGRQGLCDERHATVRLNVPAEFGVGAESLPPEAVLVPADLGPVTKLFPTLEDDELRDGAAAAPPADFLLVVDDDVDYPECLLSELLKCAQAYPGAAVGAAGLKQRSLAQETTHGSTCVVLEAWAGVLVPRAAFGDLEADGFRALVEAAAAHPLARLSDDLVVSTFLARRGVEMRVCCVPGVLERRVLLPRCLPHANDASALHNGRGGGPNNYARYRKVAKLLRAGARLEDGLLGERRRQGWFAPTHGLDALATVDPPAGFCASYAATGACTTPGCGMSHACHLCPPRAASHLGSDHHAARCPSLRRDAA